MEASLFFVLWDNEEFMHAFKINILVVVIIIIQVIFIESMSCAGYCVSTFEYYYIILFVLLVTIREMNPGELGDLPSSICYMTELGLEPDLLTAVLY